MTFRTFFVVLFAVMLACGGAAGSEWVDLFNGKDLTGWVDVIDSRPLSQEVERRTGVRHESPQALLLAEGPKIQVCDLDLPRVTPSSRAQCVTLPPVVFQASATAYKLLRESGLKS